MHRFCARTVLLFLSSTICVPAIKREHFIQIEEVYWNYAPSGMNLIQNRTIDEDEEASIFLKRGPQRIGAVYKKAIYKEYTDATYCKEMSKPDWLGYMGPLLMAEEGDTVVIHLKNLASRPYTVHPHGLAYTKGKEGALYPDGTGPMLKEDDAVPPGKVFSYEWILTKTHSPTSDDSNCVTRLYHSHLNTVKDINSGLVGPLIICKKGTLDACGDKYANQAFTVMFLVSDENMSWYIDDNIKKFVSHPTEGLKDDPNFIESNKMHAINGFMYGNLPGLNMCQGNRVNWYTIGFGNEVDMHSVHFHGQILTALNHHTDTISLPGLWLLACNVNDHFLAGMQAFFKIFNCYPNVHETKPAYKLREYFIAAQEQVWNYAPNFPKESEAQTFVGNGPDRIGSSYKKVRYVEYTDSSFRKKMQWSLEQEHLGILGPVLRAEEGDIIRVVFKNKASRPYSIQAHGVQYTIDQDGTLYNNRYKASQLLKFVSVRNGTPLPASFVRPGTVHVYEWTVPHGAGPVKGESDCLTYLYYSAVDSVKDTSSGLHITSCFISSVLQKKYNKEFHLMATVFDENLSWYLDDNIQTFTTSPRTVNKEDEGFMMSNKMHAINGFVYNNLPGLRMCKGDKVSWHLSALGSETDIISLYFQGNRFIYRQNRRDTISLFPHISHTVTMEPDSIGQFEVVSATLDHYRYGMRANYIVEGSHPYLRHNNGINHSRKYFIAAVETEWDYSPSRAFEAEMYKGVNNPAIIFVDRQTGFIGSRYKKVVYRQFTDCTFTKEVKRGADMKHLGIMGPIIHAFVGEKVEIVFKNMASRPYSIHAHGVKTDYPHVYETKPGEIHSYTWYITKNTGPTSKQEPCIASAYYSTVDVTKDLNSGLIGPLVICRGWNRIFRLKKDVKEFATLFFIFDENDSWYLDDNIRMYIRNPQPNLKSDANFLESNKMHAINGYVYGNLHLRMEVGDKVYWHIMAMGNTVDIHTVHWHGHSVEYKLGGNHYRTDVYELVPATFQTTKMHPVYPGSWLFHCHVHDHIKAGMEAIYTVLEKRKGPPKY
uniref:ferroxidase n=1 Tax=Oryzias latipes TaxID=8090 RepID=A0A3P9H7K2_ORYLA